MNPRLFLPALLAASLASAQPAPDAASPKADNPPAAPENPAAAPDHLDTLAQQAPNAVAWVLAPLDAAVVPDIRQNLTSLREALLDEAARKPAAIPDAYKVGEQLCNVMIGALDERDRARARAGFRAVEAQTRTGISSEALDARRTSSPGKKMNWPRFDREQAQREELKSQAVNKAAVIAERPKLEWTQRADQIRPTLDALYKQFREALRKSPGRTLTTIAPAVAAAEEKVPPRAAESAVGNLFENANFTEGTEGWSITRNGNVTIDTNEQRNGRPSVRIINVEGTRTMVMQKIPVQPSSLYLLTAYVKTKDVVPVRGPMTKKLEEGAEVFVDGPRGGNRRSDRISKTTSAWTPVKYKVVTGPSETQIEVGFALGHYYGPVTGTAWFSEVSLTPLGKIK